MRPSRTLFLALGALTLASCGDPAGALPTGAPRPAVVIRGSASGLVDFAAGRYVVTWDPAGCRQFGVEIAPVTGATPIVLPVADAPGSIVVSVPDGRAYVNRVGQCPPGAQYEVTITPEGRA